MSEGGLSVRLSSIASFVRQGAVLADIGTDHAHLPLFLLSEGKISFAYAADINEGPLSKAKKNAAERGFSADKIAFRLTDGARGLSGLGITDYAICGMGGELIAQIIASAPHLCDPSLLLLLQPMTRAGALRAALFSLGFEISHEIYSVDAGKNYVAFVAKYTANKRIVSEVDCEIGEKNVEIVNKYAQKCYIHEKIRAFEKARDGKLKGGDPALLESLIIEGYKARLAL